MAGNELTWYCIGGFKGWRHLGLLVSSCLSRIPSRIDDSTDFYISRAMLTAVVEPFPLIFAFLNCTEEVDGWLGSACLRWDLDLLRSETTCCF